MVSHSYIIFIVVLIQTVAAVAFNTVTMYWCVSHRWVSFPELPYSRLFLNQKFSHKCLNINFGGFIIEVSIFRWFYFEVSIYFEVFEAVLHELFERDDIAKLSTVKQHCNYHCSVMLTHF